FDSLDLRVTNDLRPPRHFRFDLGLELFRRADGDAEANRRQALLHLGSHQNLSDLAIELVDDLLRRSSRSDHALEEQGLLARDALLRKGRHVGKLGSALAARPRERT